TNLPCSQSPIPLCTRQNETGAIESSWRAATVHISRSQLRRNSLPGTGATECPRCYLAAGNNPFQRMTAPCRSEVLQELPISSSVPIIGCVKLSASQPSRNEQFCAESLF